LQVVGLEQGINLLRLPQLMREPAFSILSHRGKLD